MASREASGESNNVQNIFTISQRLLDHDCTSSEEEEILGESLNIPYKNKYISRNQLHKYLSAHETVFRNESYKTSKCEIDNGKLLSVKYSEVENSILAKQKDLMERKKEYKKEKKPKINQSPEEQEEYVNKKQSFITELISLFYEDPEQRKPLNLRKIDQSLGSRIEKYPNFAMAALSYLKDDTIVLNPIETINDDAIVLETINETKEKLIKRGLNEYGKKPNKSHSEYIIFVSALKMIDDGWNDAYKDCDLIVLDIHTTLSMCDDCYEDAKLLVKIVENLKINVSYNFPYTWLHYTEKREKDKNEESISIKENFFHKHMEIVSLQDKEYDYDFAAEYTVPSSGYKFSSAQKEAIEMHTPTNLKARKDQKVNVGAVKKQLFPDDEKQQATVSKNSSFEAGKVEKTEEEQDVESANTPGENL